MALTQRILEDMTAWCWQCHDLADQRADASRVFFGEDDDRPVNYWQGTGELNSRERRFLGFFMFQWLLASGQRPVDVAAEHLLEGSARTAALAAVAQSRFVFAVIKTPTRRSVWLEATDGQFEVRLPSWVKSLQRDTCILTHLVPVGFGQWLLGPGWVNLPIQLGPGFRAVLDDMQADPVALERFFQGRAGAGEERPPPPSDDSLEVAVSRVIVWAGERGYSSLVMPVEGWKTLVVKHMLSADVTSLLHEMLATLPRPPSQAEAVELLPLLSNIWNNTPQPDRGGRTANEITRERNPQ